jgi:uncharacterized protein YjbI with pentapeptide repeats
MTIYEDEIFNNNNYAEQEITQTEFDHCTFVNCDFSNGKLAGCKLISCSFTNCNLSMTKLTGCQMNDITFTDCKLLGVNFSECVDFLFIVQFERCVLDYASFVKKKMVKTLFSGSSLRSVDLTECDLTKSKFIDTDLLNAQFHHTTLKEADLLTATGYSIDPETNNIRKAKFSLHSVSGLLHKYDIIIE